jgi:hypothetical protein
MKQENRLPQFDSMPGEKRTTVCQGDLTPDLFEAGRKARADEVPAAIESSAAPVEKAGVMRRLAGRLKNLRRYVSRGGTKAKGPVRPEQTEFALSRIKVVRNDLSDSDLEVIPAMKQTSKIPAEGVRAGGGRLQPFGIIWNRLSAPLLRRAAQEFHTTQRERGKLLAQPSADGGGARGS